MLVSQAISINPITELTQRVKSFQHNKGTQALFFVLSLFTYILSGSSLDFTNRRMVNLAAEFDNLEKLIEKNQISKEQIKEIQVLFNTAMEQMGNQCETVATKSVRRSLNQKLILLSGLPSTPPSYIELTANDLNHLPNLYEKVRQAEKVRQEGNL